VSGRGILQISLPAPGMMLEHIYYDLNNKPVSWGWFLCSGEHLRLHTIEQSPPTSKSYSGKIRHVHNSLMVVYQKSSWHKSRALSCLSNLLTAHRPAFLRTRPRIENPITFLTE
jgi:hypothetical protein